MKATCLVLGTGTAIPLTNIFNPRAYTQIHTPTVVQGGVGVEEGVTGTPPRSF